ncbi:hypothetical protein [Shewanella surugensis]|uniref:Uncharacterized protein n=1 Tax=Shewanella surugensis TaxID=212020 RepID=A0ABT0L5X9_9GAMM|nr:hypothetical protein [Shewanella surugensis]MCL1123089.1 hypothetical protein [Shewanella surugensis]
MNNWVRLLFIALVFFHVEAVSKQCNLPQNLENYTLLFRISGMSYKVSPDAMVFRELSFLKYSFEDKSLVTGKHFKAKYRYQLFTPDVAFIDVYRDEISMVRQYRNVLVCQSDFIGQLIYTPEMNISIPGVSKSQITGKYILRKHKN